MHIINALRIFYTWLCPLLLLFFALLMVVKLCTHRSTCQPTGRKGFSIFKANLSLLNKFLKNFTPCFSKKQMAIFVLVIYALFKDYKRNFLEAMAGKELWVWTNRGCDSGNGSNCFDVFTLMVFIRSEYTIVFILILHKYI